MMKAPPASTIIKVLPPFSSGVWTPVSTKKLTTLLGLKLSVADSDDGAQRSEMIAIRGGHPVDMVWVSVSKVAVNR
jgi:hypothetical protein